MTVILTVYNNLIFTLLKKHFEINYGEEIVLSLTELQQTYCIVYFDNSFNFPMLNEKVLAKGIYTVGRVRSSRKQMPTIKNDKQTKQGDADFKYSHNSLCSKWYNNKPVLVLVSNNEGMDECSTVERCIKYPQKHQ